MCNKLIVQEIKVDIELSPELSHSKKIMEQELSKKGYIDFKYLGHGAQGIVLLAREKSTNRRYAIKGIQVRDEDGKESKSNLEQCKKEIEMLKKCKGSPYVINLISELQGKQFNYLILQECKGTLKEIIENSKNKRLNELSSIKYAIDIAEGLLFIHSQNCLLNDLKMDNILIDYDGNAVVSDLGFADNVVNSGYGEQEYMGNFFFQAPECYDKTKYDKYYKEYKQQEIVVSGLPSTRSEACSLGYILYTMIQGQKSIQFIFNKHMPLEYDESFQELRYKNQLQDVIGGLTKFIPRERLSIKDVLIKLKKIISLEFQLDIKFFNQFKDDDSGSKQKIIRQFLKDIEFIQTSSNTFYPIIKNEKEVVEQIRKKFDNNELISMIEDKDKIIQDLKKQIQQYQNEQKEMIEFNDQLKKQNQDLEKQIEDKEKTNQNQKKQIEQYQDQMKNRKKFDDQLKKQIQDLDNITQNLKNEIQQYQEQQAIENDSLIIKQIEEQVEMMVKILLPRFHKKEDTCQYIKFANFNRQKQETFHKNFSLGDAYI
ncbi:hypothetical protein ABPG74_019913 [Tetrahymena malaccensis]